VRRYSLFQQRHDRIAFVAYFLGAVVPLGALAFALSPDGHVLLGSTGAWTGAWTGTVAGVGLLSLASFFALRRTAQQALRRMDEDNRRLVSLLGASRALSAAPDLTTAAHETGRVALEMARADFAAVLKPEADGTLVVEAAGTTDEEVRDVAWALHRALERAVAADAPLPQTLADGRHAVVVPLRTATQGRAEGALLVVRRAGGPLQPEELDVLATLAGLAAVSLATSDLRDAQRNFFSHVTTLLTRALDAHLGRQEDHGHRVARLANRVARALDLPEERVERLHWAALLHDVGMLGVPRERHSDREAREPHSRLGHDMLRPIRFWERSAPIVLHHHERYDGLGYPDGLAAEAIPLESRIVAVCDAFDAMVSRTSYQPVRNVDEALDELRRHAGTQFDPHVVRAFLALVEQGIIDVAEAAPSLAGIG
jgi:putative nucleotidyltransferase with HDIG domain